MKQILPVLDTEKLQEMANEYAMKGAIKSIEEYYSGYNSPFRKAIDENLAEKGTSIFLELPDVLALINQGLSTEIDKIVNTSIAKTFIPKVTSLLTRAEKEINFSDILKAFIEETDAENPDDCDIEFNSDNAHGWLNIKLTHQRTSYHFTLHLHDKSKNESQKKYWIGSLPYSDGRNDYKMSVIIDEGRKIEMPFTKDILSDKFVSFIARIVLAHSLITIDADYFSEDMFPERCHC